VKTLFQVCCAGHHVATATLSKNRNRLYDLNTLNVPPLYRGRKFGRALLKQVLDAADVNNIELRLVPNPSGGLGRRKLEAWYFRNGFRPHADGYWYRDPVVVMQALPAASA
jgi:GNAT superfamily N-acetyltransferase